LIQDFLWCRGHLAFAFNLLVGVPSTEVPSLLRVKPGDPDNSYIIQKLENHAAVGTSTPPGRRYFGIPQNNTQNQQLILMELHGDF